MSQKRQATSELNHENWDQEDTQEVSEGIGTFQTAPKEEIAKRVIRTAKRRMQASSVNNEAKKNVFTGFGGFNKTQPSSFDFLANLTNNSSKNSTLNSENVTTSPFKSLPNSSSPSLAMSVPTTKSIFGATTTQSIFGTSPPSVSSGVAELKPETPSTSMPFKIASEPSKEIKSSNIFSPTSTSASTNKILFSSTSPPSGLFTTNNSFRNVITTNAKPNDSDNKSVFSSNNLSIESTTHATLNESDNKNIFSSSNLLSENTTNEKLTESENKSIFSFHNLSSENKTNAKLNESASKSIFSSHNMSSENKTNSKLTESENKSIFSFHNLSSENKTNAKLNDSAKSIFSSNNLSSEIKTVDSKSIESNQKTVKENDEKKMKYYAKIQGLNESVSEWIQKHVSETPLCILTPIFKDYENYLSDIKKEYESSKEKDKSEDGQTSSTVIDKTHSTDKSEKGIEKSPFSKKDSTDDKPLMSSSQSSTAVTSSSTGFSFGVITTQSIQTTSLPFSFATNTISQNSGTPFSFGAGKPFSFSQKTLQPSTEESNSKAEEEKGDDEPPKVEYTPIVEENSVYDKKCKVFVKKDGNFADKGIGTLYIKKVEGSEKYQLLVRANTSLGNILINLILASAIPVQKMGKNNVMLVCIPTPDCNPPPTTVLIRVKTSEEADELLETLIKYKV